MSTQISKSLSLSFSLFHVVHISVIQATSVYAEIHDKVCSISNLRHIFYKVRSLKGGGWSRGVITVLSHSPSEAEIADDPTVRYLAIQKLSFNFVSRSIYVFSKTCIG